jgi:hypothetical protein
MDLVLTFADHSVSGDGSDDIGQFVITGVPTRQTGTVAGRRLTSRGVTFTIATLVSAKGFRNDGNCRASQAVFTSARSAGEGEQDRQSAEEPAPMEEIGFASCSPLIVA